MTKAWFVTGTDTEIGKTFVSCALLHAARAQGLAALGMKPVAAGTDANGKNEDVEALLAAGSQPLAREIINPYLMQPAIAPHIAAAEAGLDITFQPIQAAYAQVATQADVVIVEGVGGFCVPLGPELTTADLAVSLNLPVILVVGMRLGCINHALLTVESIARRGLPLAGWVANCVDPRMQSCAENIAALQEWIQAPLLGIVPRIEDGTPAKAAPFLTLPD